MTWICELSNLHADYRLADGRGLSRAADRSWIPCSISLFLPYPLAILARTRPSPAPIRPLFLALFPVRSLFFPLLPVTRHLPLYLPFSSCRLLFSVHLPPSRHREACAWRRERRGNHEVGKHGNYGLKRWDVIERKWIERATETHSRGWETATIVRRICERAFLPFLPPRWILRVV